MDIGNEKFDIIIQAGQSNAEGCGRGPVSEEYVKDGDVFYLTKPFESVEGIKDGIWKLILTWSEEPPRISVADEREHAGHRVGDFALTFAREYKRGGCLSEGRRLLIVRAGVGGTGFMKGYWRPDGECYLNMIELVDYALSLSSENRIVGFLWHQGEHDAFEHNDPDTFEQQLKVMIADVKKRYSLSHLPFIAADFVNEWKSENIEICTPIVDKIRKVTSELGGAFVETSDLDSNNQKIANGDGIHFCRESLHILGRRYFDAYKTVKGHD